MSRASSCVGGLSSIGLSSVQMGGSLLVSYSANSDDRGDLIYADAYRPKFIRIRSPPHTFAGSSSATSSSQNFSIGMQFTTCAVTLIPAGRSSNRTGPPNSSGRWNSAAHPCGFTRSVRDGSENGCAGSRPERVNGISQLIRVPLRSVLGLGNELNFKFNNSLRQVKA